jgi:hypothetical protein
VKYLFLTYLEEKTWNALSEAEQRTAMEQGGHVARDLMASGKFLGGAPLHPVATATTLRTRGGKRLLTDGPFAETREQLGGYTIIDVKDLNEAIDIAARFLGPDGIATIEIRPIDVQDGIPPH